MAPLRLDIAASRAVLTLSDGDRGNRLNNAVLQAFSAALDELETRTDYRTVTLCAEGRMFCVGGALDEFLATPDFSAYAREVVPAWHKVISRLSNLPVPMITSIQGPVLGAGNGLAMTADIIISAETAFFCAAYSGVGISPDLGTSWQFLRRAGLTFAKDFMISNRRISAEEARVAGLINEVVAPEKLSRRTKEIAEAYAKAPRASTAAIKRLMADPGDTLRSHLAREEAEFLATSATPDAREGIKAFADKRLPKFS